MKKQYVINSEGLTVYYDSSLMTDIEKKLGALSSEKYNVMKNAVNATAKKAKADLIAKAQNEYTAKKGSLGKATTMKRATAAKPDAVIRVKGEPLEVRGFKTSANDEGVKAKIVQSGNFKIIQSQKGGRAKAFVTAFQSGHKAVVQRQENGRYSDSSAIKRRKEKWGKHADMTRIKKLLSISFPKMVGGSKVLGEIGPSIMDELKKNIQIEIRKVLDK